MTAEAAELQRAVFRRILLIKPSSLGDVIHALPVLNGLRRRYPDSAIDWLISTACAPLLEGHPDIHQLVRFDRRKFGRMARSFHATVEFGRFVRGLRTARYDLVVDLQGLFRTGFFARATGARVRLGFADAREGAWAFYTHRIPPDPPNTHAVDRNYRVADCLGFADVPIAFSLPMSDTLRAGVAARLAAGGLRPGSRLVAVVPGARWETKVWPAGRFTRVIDALQNEQGVQCVLLGGPDESNLCRGIAQDCHTAPINLGGATSVTELAAVIEKSDLVVGQDSAAMHLAVLFRRPLVCLVGPTNPHRTGPYRRIQDVVRLDLECAPCYFRRLTQCPHDHRCMRDLAVEEVLAAARHRLSSSGVCPS